MTSGALRMIPSRGRRAGKGLMPGNPAQWDAEHNGLDVRRSLAIGVNDRLPVRNAFRSLDKCVDIMPHGKLWAAQEHIDLLRGRRKATWSAMALPMPDKTVVVIYNDSHPLTRTRASLMEEYFHLKLGHPCAGLRILNGKPQGREKKPDIEEEAFFSGAAALLPYQALKEMVDSQMSRTAIAEHFQVSGQLVNFRAKVTKLYRKLKKS